MKLPVIPAVQALKYGYELANAAAWKNTATATAALTGLLSALASIAAAQGWLTELPQETIISVSSAIVALISTFLGYLNVATSRKIGVRVKQAPDGLFYNSDQLHQHIMDGSQRLLTEPEVRAMLSGITDAHSEQIIADTQRELSAALDDHPTARRVLPDQTPSRPRDPRGAFSDS